MMESADLIERIAATLRRDIGPAVTEPYARTQAFMASVVLGKLAAELRSSMAHAAAATTEIEQLVTDLTALAGTDGLPHGVQGALDLVRRAASDAALADLVGQIYGAHEILGSARFDALLGRLRLTLRARLDRAMEYAA
jgi:hypothetical protein